MRLIILHYHIFKNAGSTIEDILDHSFGERFSMLETPKEEGLISNPDLVRFFDARPSLRAFSSHQIRHPLPAAPGYLFFDICFLRDPIDRIRSIYDYFRQKPNAADPISVLANRCRLGSFVAGMIEDFPLFVKNVQVNLMACGGDSHEPQPRDLDLAIQRMLETSFLGVVDCFDQSAVAGTHALRCAFPELDWARPAVNVSGGLQGSVAIRTEMLRLACGEVTYEALLRLNALDRQLVDRARAEVLHRFRQVSQRIMRSVRMEKRCTHAQSGSFTTARRFVNLAPYWRELSGSTMKRLFDAEYYRTSSQNESVNRLPLLHFLMKGAYQGRQPHALFDSAFYLRKYPDVAAASVNPLCHYLKHGAAELRQPHPLFDSSFYLDRNPDVRRAGINPLLHYVCHGAAEDRKPLPLFQPSHYRSCCPGAPRNGQNLLAHFLESGAEAAQPHPLFDCEAYLDSHPDAAAQGINPLVHYLLSDAVSHNAPMYTDPPFAGTASIAYVDIQDTQVVVVCLDVRLGSRTSEERRAIHEAWKIWVVNQGMSRSVALVWPDACGLAQWIAEPQQEPFLQTVRLDQIRAQGLTFLGGGL